MSALPVGPRARALAALACLGFGAHWACVALYLSAPNPLRDRARPLLERYVGAFFYQRWRLFAPDPATYSKKLIFRCLPEGGAWTPWRQAGERALHDHHRYRIGPHGRLLRVPIGLAIELSQDAQRVDERPACGPAGGNCGEAAARSAPQRRPVHVVARHYVEAQCRAPAPAGAAPLEAVQFGVRRVHVRPFARRDDPSADLPPSDFVFAPVRVGGHQPAEGVE